MIENTSCRKCGEPMNGGVYRQANRCPHCLHLQDETAQTKAKTNIADPDLQAPKPVAEVSVDIAIGEAHEKPKKQKVASKKFSSFIGEVKRRMAKPEQATPQVDLQEVILDEPIVLNSQVEEKVEEKTTFAVTGLTANDDFIVEEICLSAAATIPTQEAEFHENVKKRVNEKPRYQAKRIQAIKSDTPSNKILASKPKKIDEVVEYKVEEIKPDALETVADLKAEVDVLQRTKLELQVALKVEQEAVESAKAELELVLQAKAEAEELAQNEFSKAEKIRSETETASVAAEFAKTELASAKAKIAELECEYETLVMLGAEMSENDPETAEIQEKSDECANVQVASDEYEQVVLTVEASSNLSVQKRLGLVSAECLIAMDAIRGYVSSSNNISMRQNRNTPNVVEESRKTVLDKLKQEAYVAGGNAVLNVKVDFNQLSSGEQPLLMVMASGTSVLADL